MGLKLLLMKLDEMDGFIKIYDGIRYLILFCHLWYYVIMIGLDI